MEEGIQTEPSPIEKKEWNRENTYTHTTKFVQINLHHSKGATAALRQQLTEGKADVALIQEPWIYEQGPNKRFN
jgi:hypothetical protein